MSSRPITAFPIAGVIVHLSCEFPELMHMFIAHCQASCPLLVPMYFEKNHNNNNIEWHRLVILNSNVYVITIGVITIGVDPNYMYCRCYIILNYCFSNNHYYYYCCSCYFVLSRLQGYRVSSDGAIEKDDLYLKRIGGVVKLYAAVMQTTILHMNKVQIGLHCGLEGRDV